jgi:predicted ATPase
MDKFVTISGCSGGGKSTLLNELGRRGYPTVEEPGRRIVVDELQRDGRALPWADAVAFVRRAIELSLADRAGADASSRWVFFDRGLIDAAAALEHLTGEPALEQLGSRYRYNRRVFFAPPWPEIFVTDAQRRHGLVDALAEYGRLTAAYQALGYDVCVLPKASVAERADYIVSALTG